MKPTTIKPMVKSASLIICALLVSCNRSPCYQNFADRGKDYYLQVAEACDTVLIRNPSVQGKEHKILGDDKSLPRVLRDLYPAYVLASTNAVSVRVTAQTSSYWIMWYQNPGNQSEWRLETSDEGLRRVVLSEIKPFSSQAH
jgi:hypothetical protein